MGYLLQKVSVIERQEYIGPQGQGSLKVPESLEKLSSWFLNVISLHFVHRFQNCAQLNVSIRGNNSGFSFVDKSKS